MAVDLDGTLVNGTTLVPGAKDALQTLHNRGHRIVIHSCNNPEWVRLVLNNNDIPYDSVWDQEGKPVADYYIDDRGIYFGGDWSDVLAKLGIDKELE